MNMKIKKKLLSGHVAVPIYDKRGNFTEQTKSLKENRISYK